MPRPANWPFRLLVMLLVGACLLAACDRKADDAADSGTTVEPHGIFAQKGAQPTTQKVRRMLVVGDSLSISLGEELQRVLTGTPGLDYAWDGTKSTGLTRPELVNWPRHLRELVTQQTPDIVVIMLGANDMMPVDGPSGNRLLFGDPDWAAAYALKAQELISICRQANPKVSLYWVGVPAMGESTLAAGVRQINAALQTMCRAAGCRFIDTHAAFSDATDRFARHAKDTASGETVLIRTPDGVHLTESGSKLLSGLVLAAVVETEKLPLTANIQELLVQSRDLKVVPDAAPAPQPAPAPRRHVAASNRVYTLREGETIAIVAKKLHLPEEDILAVNPGINTRRLSIGQTLRLPRRHK